MGHVPAEPDYVSHFLYGLARPQADSVDEAARFADDLHAAQTSAIK